MTGEAIIQNLRHIVAEWKEVKDGEKLEDLKAGKQLLCVFG